MWKLVLGFVVFAVIALFVIMKAGDQVDMSGEKHGVEAVHAPEPAAAPASAASAAQYGCRPRQKTRRWYHLRVFFMCGPGSAAELAVGADDGQVQIGRAHV